MNLKSESFDYERNVSVFFLALVVIMAVLRIYENFCVGFTHDSSQHLHISWLLSQGQLPYKDFFDNHPPLFWLPMSLLFRKVPFPDVQTFFYIVKIATSVCFLLLLWALFVLSKQLFGRVLAGLFSVLVFLASVSVRDVYFEVRPQIFMFIFFLLGMHCFFSYLEIERKELYLVLAISMLVFSQMLLPIMPYISLAVFFYMVALVLWDKGVGYAWRYLVMPAIIVAGLSVLVMTTVAGISDLYNFVVKFNFTIDPNAIAPKYKYFEPFTHMPILVFGILGGGAVIYKRMNRYYIIIGFLVISSIELLFLFHSLWPQHYMPFYIFLSLLAGAAVSWMRINRIVRFSFVMGAGILSIYIFTLGNMLLPDARPPAHDYLNNIRYMLDNSNTSDTVFISPGQHPIFRKDASYYWFGRWDLVGTMQEHIEEFDFLPFKDELVDVRIPLLKNNPKYIMGPTSSWWSPLDAANLRYLPASMFTKRLELIDTSVVAFDKDCLN